MWEEIAKLLVEIVSGIHTNLSVVIASVLGAIISLFVREHKTWGQVFAAFLTGIFSGWYFSLVIHNYIPLPIEAIAAIMAIMGRDLVQHIVNIGKENPAKLFSYLYKIRLQIDNNDKEEKKTVDNEEK